MADSPKRIETRISIRDEDIEPVGFYYRAAAREICELCQLEATEERLTLMAAAMHKHISEMKAQMAARKGAQQDKDWGFPMAAMYKAGVDSEEIGRQLLEHLKRQREPAATGTATEEDWDRMARFELVKFGMPASRIVRMIAEDAETWRILFGITKSYVRTCAAIEQERRVRGGTDHA